MKLHDKTKDKLRLLFNHADNFCEKQLELYSEFPDVVFMVTVFETAFSDFSSKLRIKKVYTQEQYHEEIFEIDSILSNWRNHLTYRFPTETSENNNDVYSVLFSILQGSEDIISEDHFYWEDEPTIEPEEDLVDEKFIDKTF